MSVEATFRQASAERRSVAWGTSRRGWLNEGAGEGRHGYGKRWFAKWPYKMSLKKFYSTALVLTWPVVGHGSSETIRPSDVSVTPFESASEL